jgi:large repetitive protein
VTPVQGLAPSTVYTLTVNGVTDLAGNGMSAAFSSTFTTGQVPDLTELKVLSVSPGNGAGGVPLNALVEVGFNKAADAVSLGSGNLSVYAYDPGTGAVQGVAGTVAIDASGESVRFTPSAALTAEAEYCVGINGVEDLEGEPLEQNGQTLSCFTTGVLSATSALTVTGVSPSGGETGTPVNTAVEIELSAAVSAVSVTPGAITVAAGSTPVPGTVTQPSANTLLFTPSGTLAVSTAYTVKAGGFTDLAGNAASPFTSAFTTGSSPTSDKGPLSVLSIAPPNGSTSVAVGSTVTVTFNEAVNPLTVNTDSVNVQSNGGNVAGTYAVSGATVVFTPATPLPGSSTVSVCVDCYGSVEDLAGNNGSGASASFTTASTGDTTAPRVVSVTPSSGATGMGLNGQVTIVFSKSMNPADLGSNWSNSQMSLLAGGQRLAFNVSVSADDTTATLYALNLPASSAITLSVPHTVEDLSGNNLASDYASQFTTGAGFDTTHASVVNQRPSNGATGVGVTASPVVLYWNKALNAATVPGALHVSQNGELVTGTVTVADGGQTVEFAPSSPWENGALVQVFVDTTAEDVGGNGVTAYTGSFTVVADPATTKPAAVNVSPASGAKGVPLNAIIQAGYSEPISVSTVIAAAVYLNGPSGTVASTLSLDATGTVVQLQPSSPLAAGSQYCFYAYGSQSVTGGLQGTNGQPAGNVGYCFTTGATTATAGPTVTVVSPENKLAGVAVNANIGLVFSAPIDPLTVNGTTVSVTGGDQTSVPASIAFSNLNQTVEITPQAPLPAATAMTITVGGVTDVAGNAVAGFTSTFTTGTLPATASAGMVAANPPAGATGVPVNAALGLTASAELDATTIDASTFQVWDTVLNQQVAGTYSLSGDGLTAYFVPSAELATGRTYTVYFGSYGMTDVAGNGITGCCGYLNNYSFTTGFATSGTGPAVTGVSPASGLTGVPLNAQIVVGFSEPVDAGSLGGVTLKAGSTQVAVTTSLSNGNQLLTVTPVQGLAPSTVYTLTVNGVTDLAGNGMSAAFSSTFTTGQVPNFVQPVVAAITPNNNATGVATNSTIQIQFNKVMDPLTITGPTITVSNGSVPVAGTVTVNAARTVATFTPSAPLATVTVYNVSISSGITDLEGLALTALQSTFTTGSQ